MEKYKDNYSISIILVVLFFISGACNSDNYYSSKSDKEQSFAITNRDMKIRQTPSADNNSKVLGTIKEGEVVKYLGEKSERVEKMEWNDGVKTDYWYKVETRQIPEGWIYGGGINFMTKENMNNSLKKVEDFLGEKNYQIQEIKGCNFLKDFIASDYKRIRLNEWQKIQHQRPEDLREKEHDNYFHDETFILGTIDLSYNHIYGILMLETGYMGGTYLLVYNFEGYLLNKILVATCDGDAFQHWESDFSFINNSTISRSYKFEDDIDEINDGHIEYEITLDKLNILWDGRIDTTIIKKESNIKD